MRLRSRWLPCCQALCCAFEEAGFQVAVASDGREALASAIEHRPQLVILDMGLPLIDGPGVDPVLTAIYRRDVPTVNITDDRQWAARAQEIGAAQAPIEAVQHGRRHRRAHPAGVKRAGYPG